MPPSPRLDLHAAQPALARLLQGERAAWCDFVGAAAPVVRAVARKVLAPAGQDAELADVVQDTFAALCRDDFNLLRRYDPARASLATYLGVVAGRRALDHLRRAAPAAVDLDAVPEERLAVDPALPAGPLRLPDDLLTPRQALILRLIYERDLDVDEVALRLGIAAQSVRSLRHKALERLRGHLRAAGDVSPPGRE
ncbi:RNA polymerase sigma factor [Parasulfuritortus cantonensis]|nr:sigma-70 family RNA polymerase sigma factor [Parasulfuritortus cantonensis]